MKIPAIAYFSTYLITFLKTGSHVTEAGLEFIMQRKMTLNFYSASNFQVLGLQAYTTTPGVQGAGEWNPGLGVRQVNTLPTGLQPQPVIYDVRHFL